MEDNILISFSIDTTAGIVTLEYTGDPSFNEWASTMDVVLHDAAFRPGYGLLLDRSQLTTAPEPHYIQRVVEYVQVHESQLGGSRVATLVNSLAAYGMARMAEILLDDTTETVRVFYDRVKALEWIRRADTPCIDDRSFLLTL